MSGKSLKMVPFILCILLANTLALASTVFPRGSLDPLKDCPGYEASNVLITASGLTADLSIAGPACNVYGDDLQSLSLTVTYENSDRLHVKIQDTANSVYQIPASVFPRPGGTTLSALSKLKFTYTASPFSFAVQRATTGEVLFDTSAANIVFESQYVRLRTKLPVNPNLYGLGEHSDPFRLNTTDYIRTLWSNDAYAIPPGENLYGNHPVYFEHRTGGTHGVLFLNSNGMDIMINNTAEDGQYLEYNTLGGTLDFYFLSGPDPIDVSQQYAQLVGLPAMMPYFGFGFHQCRYGYQDVYNVAEVVYNYSQAGIPLETMWTDIDYMDGRKVFSLDPQRFPLDEMQELVDYLHSHDQHYVVMVDPAVAYQPYGPFERGEDDNIFLKRANGSIWQGVVWPGVTAFPDWFSANITAYWNNEFTIFFNPGSGVDIDALWIDMNEPSNFPCNFPCDNPYAAAVGYPPTPPPVRSPPRPLPGFPCSFQPPGTPCTGDKVRKWVSSADIFGRPSKSSSYAVFERQTPGKELGLPGRDLLFPKYAIHNAEAYTVEDNAGGGGISNHTVNTNLIHQNGLAMYGITTVSRHSYLKNFYQWPSVAEAAKKVIDVRYMLLDYIYTALYKQTRDGTPLINPMWYLHPDDPNTFDLDLQYYFGPGLLVSPVTEENATTVTIYLPDAIYYDAWTYAPVRGTGSTIEISDVDITDIPLHFLGGVIYPMRVESAMTTSALRAKDFNILVAIGLDGRASGDLYLDDGESLVQTAITFASFAYADGVITMKGHYGYSTQSKIASITVLGLQRRPAAYGVNGVAARSLQLAYNETSQAVVLPIGHAFTADLTVALH